MRVLALIKIIMLLIILIFMLLFFTENMDPVKIYFPVLRGRHIGLVFIMFGSYCMGILSTLLFIGILGRKIKKRRERSESDEEEELFEEE